MKRLHLHCPYCRAPVVRRRSRDLFGQSARDPDALYYVCAQYPHCDAYVSAHRKSGLPMGTLADPALRRKRIQTHQVFDRIWKDGPTRYLRVPVAARGAGSARIAGPYRLLFSLSVRPGYCPVRRPSPGGPAGRLAPRRYTNEQADHIDRYAARADRTQPVCGRLGHQGLYQSQSPCLWVGLRRTSIRRAVFTCAGRLLPILARRKSSAPMPAGWSIMV